MLANLLSFRQAPFKKPNNIDKQLKYIEAFITKHN